ncbi:MAG: hypothetical protein OIF47_15315 [Marinibacterium sp.]|nr:hypothetical protein [Marinibacterium sp.]
MSNVIQLNVPSPRQAAEDRLSALISCFARHRRFGDDVFWLKENAELLNILECTGATLAPDALAPHQGFYDGIEKRLGFFPQYYRFLLSICLDLEDLGMTGNKGEALAAWVAREGLAEAELSDLQRAEARRLLARRDVKGANNDAGLTERLHNFINRSKTFAMPNKKASYELTHIVFYLSEYGRRDPQLSQQAVTSLIYAGLLAYLDQNADLLAEICVSLRYAGETPPNAWEAWLQRETCLFSVDTGPHVSAQDDYHEYFVCNWLMGTSGQDMFRKPATHDRMAFFRAEAAPAPLRQMSQHMFDLEDRRSDDWHLMRPEIEAALSDDALHVLHAAEASTDQFDAFFAGFARAGVSTAPGQVAQ